MDDRMAMELAATQHSLIGADQLYEAGFSRRQIHFRLQQGLLARMHKGVYRYTTAVETREQHLLAACLGVGQPSAGSHRAAAAMCGIWLVPTELIEISVGRDRSPSLQGVVMHRLADLSERWIVRIDGVPVTSPARTLVDLGAVLPLGSVSRALDRALGRKLTTLPEVRAAMHAVARKGRAGVGVIRRLLEERGDEPGGSVLENRMSTLLRAHGVPAPIAQYTVLNGHGEFVGCVDFAYPELRYAIEVDGYEYHAGLREFRHDRVRQNDIVDLGWTVHRFTWDEVDTLSARVADRIRHRRLHLLGTLEYPTGT
jgi:Protein of unknown function (DUF559)